MLEISINGGAFADIITAGGNFNSGGYSRTIQGGDGSSIENRLAWSGISGGTTAGSGVYVLTDVGLPATTVGQNVQFRWRLVTDSINTNGKGWAIDNISLLDNVPPAVTLANVIATIPENTSTASPIKVADIVVTDDGVGGTNTLALAGADAASFQIIGTGLFIKAGVSLNFEAQAAYAVSVTVDDTTTGGTPDGTAPYTLAVTNVQEAPVFSGPTTFTFEEFSARNTLIGRVQATDSDGNALTYSITGGNPDNTLSIASGAVVSNGGKIYVNNQDLTGLRHRGMFNLIVRVTDNSPGALFTEVTVRIFITPSPAGNVTVTPSVDGEVGDLNGNGFDAGDSADGSLTDMWVRGGPQPIRGIMEFNLAALPGSKVLKSAWLFFTAASYDGGVSPTGNVPIDVYGYTGNGTLTSTDATAGTTKIGSRQITGYNTSNQLKVHSAQLDANFVRSFVGTGTLGLCLRNDTTTDRVAVNTSEASVTAGEKPYLVLQFADAKPDLIVRDMGPGNNEVLSLFSNGSNAFSVNTLNVFAPVAWERFVTGDFNGDGITDIAARNQNDGTWWVSLANAGGIHQTATQWGSWTTANAWSDVQVADFDKDGKADIAGRAANGDWNVSLSTGSALRANSVWGNWATSTTWSNVSTADFNRDGRADIAGRNTEGQWVVSISTGTTPANDAFSTSVWTNWSTTTTWVDVQVGDLNGDGRADIIGRSAIGQWWVNRSTGTSFGAALYYGNWSTSTTWRDVRVGDFNGDGRDDIVGRSSIGQLWLSEVSTTGFSTRFFGTWSGPQQKWIDVTVGDFNEDGHADLVAQNAQTGEIVTSLWTSTTVTPTAWAVLPNDGHNLWRLLSSAKLF